MNGNLHVAFPQSGYSSTFSRSNWNLEDIVLIFVEGGKSENPKKNPLSKDENQQCGPGIEPGPHWWEVSTFTTAPSLLLATQLACTNLHLSNRAMSFSVFT